MRQRQASGEEPAGSGMKARPVGRILRLLTGIALIVLVGLRLRGAPLSLLAATAAVFAVELVFYAAMHFVISRYVSALNPWIGAVLAVTPVAIVYFVGGAPAQVGSLAFVGISLLFTAARNDAGCEVMTLPALLFARRTHLVCIAFSPIDWLEEKMFGDSSSGLPEAGAAHD